MIALVLCSRWVVEKSSGGEKGLVRKVGGRACGGEAEEMLQTKLPEVSTNAAARRAKPAEQSINGVQDGKLVGEFQWEYDEL